MVWIYSSECFRFCGASVENFLNDLSSTIKPMNQQRHSVWDTKPASSSKACLFKPYSKTTNDINDRQPVRLAPLRPSSFRTESNYSKQFDSNKNLSFCNQVGKDAYDEQVSLNINIFCRISILVTLYWPFLAKSSRPNNEGWKFVSGREVREIEKGLFL